MSDPVVDWLLDSDPAIRWQVVRDLLDRPEDEWRAERARVETEGWGARLLALQDVDGQWAGGAFLPEGFTRELWDGEGQPWTATSFVVSQLRELGLDPACASATRMVERLADGAQWWEGAPFWGGETEECINGRLVADGVYFGVDMTGLVERLVGERLADGGWNCERVEGSVRSSFASTVNVLDGLREHALATGGTAASREARRTGEEFLLERRLFRRLSTGEVADPEFLTFLHPRRWRYDVLRALDHFRRAAMLDGPALDRPALDGPALDDVVARDGAPHPRPVRDERLADAVDVVRRRRTRDGVWLLDRAPRGRVWFEVDDGVGLPSRWVTLDALRVLRWWDSPRA